MRRAGVVFATSVVLASTLALLDCSLLTDTSGLSGGPEPGDAEAGSSDAPLGDSTTSEGGTTFDAGSTALGPLWLAYGSNAGKMGVRRWDPVSGVWETEQPGPDLTGSIVRWVVPKETPLGSFLAVESSNNAGARLDVFEHQTDGTWKLGFTVPMSNPARRTFDIEYETMSKAVVVVYGDTSHDPKLRRRTASGWSAEQSLPMIEPNRPAWIELARNPAANELGIVYVDEAINLVANTWNGTAWAAPQELEGNLNTLDFKAFDVAYENLSGNMVAAWGRSGTVDGGFIEDMRYTTHPLGGSFTNVQSMNVGTPPGPIVLVPELASNRLGLAFVEYNCNKSDMPCDDFVTGIWDGASFGFVANLDVNTTTLYHSRPASNPVGAAWLGTTGTLIAAYHRNLDTGPDSLAFTRFEDMKWDPVGAALAPPALPPRSSMQLVTAPGPAVVAVVLDTGGGLWSKAFRESGKATTWSDVGGGVTLASGLIASSGVPFGVTQSP